jgi:hypothetical protein
MGENKTSLKCAKVFWGSGERIPKKGNGRESQERKSLLSVQRVLCWGGRPGKEWRTEDTMTCKGVGGLAGLQP